LVQHFETDLLLCLHCNNLVVMAFVLLLVFIASDFEFDLVGCHRIISCKSWAWLKAVTIEV